MTAASLGRGYQELGNHHKSVEHYERAKSLMEADFLCDPNDLEVVCNNVGNEYKRLEVR